jgi:hypothetical protein
MHLALLRNIISESSSDVGVRIENIGKEVGRRLLDDFCARFLIFEKIKSEEIEKYLNLFLNNYLGKVSIERSFVVFEEPISDNQREVGVLLLKSILEAIFVNLNDKVSFSITNGKIQVNLNAPKAKVSEIDD